MEVDAHETQRTSAPCSEETSTTERPHRANHEAVKAAVATSDLLVAEVKGVHLTRVILLSSQEGLDDDDLRKEFDGSLVVTMHTNDFNPRISKSRRICAAIRDNTDFDELKLQEHLDKLCGDINQQHHWKQVLFMCRAGVNRSALALIYYCCTTTPGLSWRAALDAIVTAKQASSRNWPTLENEAFCDFLERKFPSSPPPELRATTQLALTTAESRTSDHEQLQHTKCGELAHDVPMCDNQDSPMQPGEQDLVTNRQSATIDCSDEGGDAPMEDAATPMEADAELDQDSDMVTPEPAEPQRTKGDADTTMHERPGSGNEDGTQAVDAAVTARSSEPRSGQPKKFSTQQRLQELKEALGEIAQLHNPAADGNCGYRAVAEALGLSAELWHLALRQWTMLRMEQTFSRELLQAPASDKSRRGQQLTRADWIEKNRIAAKGREMRRDTSMRWH